MKILLFNTNLATLSVITQLDKNEKFVVITDQKNIVELMRLLKYDNVELYFIQSGFALKQIPSLINSKRNVKAIFQKYSFSDLIYYHQAFGGLYNWIISYAHKKGISISYHRVLRKIDGEGVYSLRALKCKMIYSLLYHTNVKVIGNGGGDYTPRLSDHFLRKNEVKEQWAVYDKKIVSLVGKEIISKLNISSCHNKVLLLTGSVVSTNRVNFDDYCKKMKVLIETIGPERIVCKCHPRFSDEIEIEKNLPHLPSYIPMELLDNLFSVYIGFASSVLINAAKQRKTSISLINYFEIVDDTSKKFLEEYLEGYGIVFIRNVVELKEIINDNENN